MKYDVNAENTKAIKFSTDVGITCVQSKTLRVRVYKSYRKDKPT